VYSRPCARRRVPVERGGAARCSGCPTGGRATVGGDRRPESASSSPAIPNAIYRLDVGVEGGVEDGRRSVVARAALARCESSAGKPARKRAGQRVRARCAGRRVDTGSGELAVAQLPRLEIGVIVGRHIVDSVSDLLVAA
jgi:hypothetical protein